MFDAVILMSVIGGVTFDIIFLGHVKVFRIILLVFVILETYVYSIINLIRLIWPETTANHQKTYDEVNHLLPSEYDLLNPITQREAFKKWKIFKNYSNSNLYQRVKSNSPFLQID